MVKKVFKVGGCKFFLLNGVISGCFLLFHIIWRVKIALFTWPFSRGT